MRKEFYFVRHGQTDFNVAPTDSRKDESLNETGRIQAEAVGPLVRALPVKKVYFSPFKRVKETKEIALKGICLSEKEFDAFGESSPEILKYLSNERLESGAQFSPCVEEFLQRVKKGIEEALEEPGPLLIVAHRSTHWAFCYYFQIEGHDWLVDNCTLVHFFTDDQKKWRAKKLPA